MRLTTTFLAAGINLCAALCAIAQSSTDASALKKLDFYVASWSESGQMREDASKPFAAISGEETCKWAKGSERPGAEHGVAADPPPLLSLGQLASLARYAAERPTARRADCHGRARGSRQS
jgi:hypothetical protein